VAEGGTQEGRHGDGDVGSAVGDHRVDGGLRLLLGPAQPDEGREDVGRGRDAAVTVGAAARTSSLPANERTISFAVLGPMPDTRRKGASSSAATACATCDGLSVASTPWADFGPTPVTLRSRSNTSSSSSSAKPKSERSSSRTISVVNSWSVVPTAAVRASWGVTPTRRPTPPTSTTTLVPEADSTVPRTLEIICPA